jgi:hypothetical protein
MVLGVDRWMLWPSGISDLGFAVWLQSFSAPNTYWGSTSSMRPRRIDSLGVRSGSSVPETRPYPGSSIQIVLARIVQLSSGSRQGQRSTRGPSRSASRDFRSGWEGEWATNQTVQHRTLSMKPSRDRSSGLRSSLRLLYRARSCFPKSGSVMPVMRRVRPLSLRQLAWPRNRSIWNGFSRLSM